MFYNIYVGEYKMSDVQNQHIVPRESGWAVMPAQGQKASGLFDTKKEAEQHAREVARNNDTHVVVHGQDSRIQDVYEPRKDGSFVSVKESGTGLRPAQHVVPHDEGWAVRSEGKDQPSFVADSKYKAISEAHERAKDYGSTLIIHNEDGTFRRIDEAPHFPSAAADALHMR